MGHKIPISMTYHGSGVRPDQHPGWVGLGWNLNAGGCISRIVNGLPDETYREDYEGRVTKCMTTTSDSSIAMISGEIVTCCETETQSEQDADLSRC